MELNARLEIALAVKPGLTNSRFCEDVKQLDLFTARSLAESLELFGVSFPAETSYTRRDFWESNFRHFLASNMAKKRGKWTRVVVISFTKYHIHP